MTNFSLLRKNNNENGAIIWQEDQINYVINEYQTHYSIPTIAKQFNTSPETIRKLLRKKNVKVLSVAELRHKKFPRNSNFFHNIDTPEKAYWLGFLMADGYITTDNKVRLNLKKDDEDHLKKFLKALNATNHTIKYSTKTEKDKVYYQAYCSIGDQTLVEDLSALGCVNAKSYILQFPKDKIPSSLYSHFIRGYFDGDGSLNFTISGKNKTPNWRINFIGTKSFLEDLRHILDKDHLALENHKTYYSFTINGNKQIKPILEYIYNNSDDNMELTRKRLVYNQYLLQPLRGEPKNLGCD